MNTNFNFMNSTSRITPVAILIGILSLATGCVEHRVTYVPVYPSRPVYQVQPAPPPPPVVVYQSQPVVVKPAPAPPPPAPTPPPPPDHQPKTPPPVVTVKPPPPPFEVIPVAPGPVYVWTPGYWSWQGSWVWVRGAWVMPPRPKAVWVNGHWVYHHHGYTWVPGHWR
jgi:hypothetical protein